MLIMKMFSSSTVLSATFVVLTFHVHTTGTDNTPHTVNETSPELKYAGTSYSPGYINQEKVNTISNIAREEDYGIDKISHLQNLVFIKVDLTSIKSEWDAGFRKARKLSEDAKRNVVNPVVYFVLTAPPSQPGISLLMEQLMYGKSKGFQNLGMTLTFRCALIRDRYRWYNEAYTTVDFVLINIDVKAEILLCGIEIAARCVQQKIEKYLSTFLKLNSSAESLFEITSTLSSQDKFSPDAFTNNMKEWTEEINVKANVTLLVQSKDKLLRATKDVISHWVVKGETVLTNRTYYQHVDQPIISTHENDDSFEVFQDNTENVKCNNSANELQIPSTLYDVKESDKIESNYTFSPTNFGVQFRPKYNDLYDADDLIPLINLISTKFHNILTYPTSSIFELILDALGDIPVVAAEFNKRNSLINYADQTLRVPGLKVFIEVIPDLKDHFLDNFMDWGTKNILDYADALAEAANSVFEGTVPYVLVKFNNPEGPQFIKILTQINGIVKYSPKNITDEPITNDKFGASLDISYCSEIKNPLSVFTRGFPFLLFTLNHTKEKCDVETFLASSITQFHQCLTRIRDIPSHVPIGFHTWWPDTDSKGNKNVTAFAWFWKHLNAWAVKENVIVFVDSAFDDLRHRYDKHTGWWKFPNDKPCYGSTKDYDFNENVLSVSGSNNAGGSTCPFTNGTDIVLAGQLVRVQLLKESAADLTGLHKMFSGENFGVVLGSSVLPGASNEDYTNADVQFILNLVRTRFSRVLLKAVNKNTKWFNEPKRRIPLVAAEMNKKIFSSGSESKGLENSLTKPLHIFIPFRNDYDHNNRITFNASFEIAMSIADEANKIFPSTVEYLIMDLTDLNLWLSMGEPVILFKQLLEIKQSQNHSLYEMGIMINFQKGYCYDDLVAKRHILEYIPIVFLNFIDVLADVDNPESSFQFTVKILEQCVGSVKRTFPHLKVYSVLKFGEPKTSISLEGLTNYWQRMNQYAIQNNITVFMIEAFDQSDDTTKTGWWRITEKEYENYAKIQTLQEKYQVVHNSTTFDDHVDDKPAPTPDKSNFNLIVGVVASVSVLLVILATVGGAVVRIRKIGREALAALLKLSEEEIREFFEGRTSRETEGEEVVSSEEDNDYYRYTALFENFAYDKGLEIEKEDFSVDEVSKLGAGVFGRVSVGTVHLDGCETKVAVKMVCSSGTGDEKLISLRSILSEIKVLSYLGRHENVLAILGAHTGDLRKGAVYAFLELCSGGSLHDRLETMRKLNAEAYSSSCSTFNDYSCFVDNDYDITLLDKWSIEIVEGMTFLASKHVVHADLATRNVLLDRNKTAKICDFGLSRRLINYQSYVKTHQEPLPWRSMAPESLRCCVFNEKTDVWAFGVTLWEIYALGEVPYAGISWTANFALLIENGLRLPPPNSNEGSLSSMYSTMQLCWATNPKERPSFRELKGMLSDIYTNNCTKL